MEVVRIPNSIHAANNRRDRVSVSETGLNSPIGEPEHHFHRATDFYVMGAAYGAATEVRTVGALHSLYPPGSRKIPGDQRRRDVYGVCGRMDIAVCCNGAENVGVVQLRKFKCRVKC